MLRFLHFHCAFLQINLAQLIVCDFTMYHDHVLLHTYILGHMNKLHYFPTFLTVLFKSGLQKCAKIICK